MTEWICPCCGYLNPDEVRVAFKTPCQRCGKDKRTPEEVRESHNRKRAGIQKEIDRLEREIAGKGGRIHSISDYILEMEQEKEKIREEIMGLHADLVENEDALEIINEIKIHVIPTKTIHPDQAKLVSTGVLGS
jgi:septal ring factor EnvC (AmiA/AmiB activator)